MSQITINNEPDFPLCQIIHSIHFVTVFPSLAFLLPSTKADRMWESGFSLWNRAGRGLLLSLCGCREDPLPCSCGAGNLPRMEISRLDQAQWGHNQSNNPESSRIIQSFSIQYIFFFFKRLSCADIIALKAERYSLHSELCLSGN